MASETEKENESSSLRDNPEGEEAITNPTANLEPLTEVEGVTSESALVALKEALRCPSAFWQELMVREPTTIQDALHRFADYVRVEDAILARTQKTSRPKQTNESGAPAPKKNNPGFVRHEGGFTGAHNYHMESSGSGRGRGRGRERGRGTWNNTWTRDQSSYEEKLYCEFHKAAGHTTARCRELGRLLATRLAAGDLKGDFNLSDFKLEAAKVPAAEQAQAIEGGENPKRPRRDNNPDNQGSQRVLNMIMGGSQYCADNVLAIEAYQQRAEVSVNLSAPVKQTTDPLLTITFDEQDTEGIDCGSQKSHN
ncbi:hypothetical protein AALP_AA7G170000 [Arabis alpina]|uniref:Retrotransposon gag domain-containing protein n=1 Tax=Arabis alpina TaxID=50452 RepID=A0A087GIL9_ARAAL|nr:hypothetical protein AALP_AA7G170000 [Arabis alpina]